MTRSSRQAQPRGEAEGFAECGECDAERQVVHELHRRALSHAAEVESLHAHGVEDLFRPREDRFVASREELQRAVGRGLDASGDGHVAEVGALLTRALRRAARRRGRHRGEVEPDLSGGEAGDEAVRPVRDGLERRGVGEHRADDVGGGRRFARARRDGCAAPRSRERARRGGSRRSGESRRGESGAPWGRPSRRGRGRRRVSCAHLKILRHGTPRTLRPGARGSRPRSWERRTSSWRGTTCSRTRTTGRRTSSSIPRRRAKPRTTDEVSRLLAFCNERRIPVTPQGGRTCLSGGALPSGRRPRAVSRAHERHPRDRHRQLRGRRRGGRRDADAPRGRRGEGAVLPARPGFARLLHDRRQRRRERGRAARGQVRRHGPLGDGPRGGVRGRRRRRHGRQDAQGRGGLRPHVAPSRERRHARRRHEGLAAPHPEAAVLGDARRAFPDAGGRGALRPRAAPARPRASRPASSWTSRPSISRRGRRASACRFPRPRRASSSSSTARPRRRWSGT